MVKSAYIHIPFCLSKCKYCSFVSYEKSTKEQREHYVSVLTDEIKHFYKQEPLNTLYFGGGTPSLLETAQIKRILDCFSVTEETEITIEVNPETVEFSKLSELKDIGINRLSVGIQSFDDEILRYIGRAHKAERAAQTLVAAQKAGFDNISADFIYGLPFQTQDEFINDLQIAVQLGVDHISLYGLKIEKGCAFYGMFDELSPNLPDDDMQADMYLAAIEFLEQENFNHYEISNFARENKFSRHNLNYWNEGEYYGFGAAAHGFVDGVRYSNFEKLEDYEKNFTKKKEKSVLSKQEMLEETIFLGFRKGEGINTEEINKKYGIDFDSKYKQALEKYIKTAHLIKTPNGYRLSNEGFLLSNVILSEFISSV